MLERLGALFLVALLCACDAQPTSIPETAVSDPTLSVIGADPLVGAIVLNQGEASEPFVNTCSFGGRVTTDVVMVRNPTGGGLLRCRWSPWPTSTEFDRAFRLSGFNCFLNFFGFTTTDESNFVIGMNGDASMSCRFHEIPTPPTAQCYGQIVSGIASTWPWAHDDKSAFPPPPGSLHLWLESFGAQIGISTVRELQLLFCGT
jgi:hypothetical protein